MSALTRMCVCMCFVCVNMHNDIKSYIIALCLTSICVSKRYRSQKISSIKHFVSFSLFLAKYSCCTHAHVYFYKCKSYISMFLCIYKMFLVRFITLVYIYQFTWQTKKKRFVFYFLNACCKCSQIQALEY